MMIKTGTAFIYDGKPAKTWTHFPYVGLWLCKYDDASGVFYMFEEEIEKARKEGNKNNMNFEYKFYEKNLAPKWLEGDYNLHIEGNKMVMTSKDGKRVEARCHPDDDWRLQVGLDELKDRMNEVKKPREIKVGDVVKVKFPRAYGSTELTSFFEENSVPVGYIIRVVQTNSTIRVPSTDYKYRVLFVGYASGKSGNKLALIESTVTSYLYVVDYTDLRLVE